MITKENPKRLKFQKLEQKTMCEVIVMSGIVLRRNLMAGSEYT